jgi:branched-chain amino acid transport system ATP-binding protein
MSDAQRTPEGAPLLHVRDLNVYYGAIHALKGVSLSVASGRIVTLIGANGAGKSTLLRAISGLLRPRQGAIDFEGQDLARLPAHEIVARGISHVPEGRIVFANMTVYENLQLGAHLRRDASGIASDLEHVYALFPRLQERCTQAAGTLSGGEQQMLAIGRALMSRPRVLLMDEPSLGLAPLLVREIFAIIRRINQEGMTVLLVEQNAHMALSVAHEGYVLETGRVVRHDKASTLLASEEVQKAYLGG